MASLKPGQEIPLGNLIARHCRMNWLDWNPDKDRDNEDAVRDVLPTAFELSPKDLAADEVYLSIDWVDHFEGSYQDKLRKLREHPPVSKLTNRQRYAIFSTDDLKEASDRRGTSVIAKYRNGKNRPCYAGIHGLEKAEEFMLDLIDDKKITLELAKVS